MLVKLSLFIFMLFLKSRFLSAFDKLRVYFVGVFEKVERLANLRICICYHILVAFIRLIIGGHKNDMSP